MIKSVVSIVKAGEDVEPAVREAIRMAGGLEDLIGPKSRVLIKPNVASRDRSGKGIVTDARVTEAVTKIVLDRKPSRAVIGDGSAVGFDFPDLQDPLMALEESGTKAVAE